MGSIATSPPNTVHCYYHRTSISQSSPTTWTSLMIHHSIPRILVSKRPAHFQVPWLSCIAFPFPATSYFGANLLRVSQDPSQNSAFLGPTGRACQQIFVQNGRCMGFEKQPRVVHSPRHKSPPTNISPQHESSDQIPHKATKVVCLLWTLVVDR